MPHVFIRHKIANYAKWKRVVNDCKDWRKASGETSFHAYRSSKSPNDLNVVSTWSNAAQMQKFMKSAELRARMKEAGVLGKPKIEIFGTVEDMSVG